MIELVQFIAQVSESFLLIRFLAGQLIEELDFLTDETATAWE